MFDSQPIFRDAVNSLDEVLKCLPYPPIWSLKEETLRPAETSRLSIAEFSQPCCTAIQIGNADPLRHWGVEPDAVVGHSSGEIAAAHKEIVGNLCGGITTVGLGRDQVSAYLVPTVGIGYENSPESVTLTGDKDKLEVVAQAIRADYPDTLIRALQVDCAYHSYYMKTVEQEYLRLLGSWVSSAPFIPFFSSVSGKVIDIGSQLGPTYWARNMVSPVLFSNAVESLCHDMPMDKLFIEIGPQSALHGPLRQIMRKKNQGFSYVATLIRHENAALSMLKAVGNLFQHGVSINYKTLNNGRILIDLPCYPWIHDMEIWTESRISKAVRQRKFGHHDILGSRVPESTNTNPNWRNILRPESVPWIKDHEIIGDIVCPAAAYVAMAGETMSQNSGKDVRDYTVREVNIVNALVLHDGEETEIMTQLNRLDLTSSLAPSYYSFAISSFNGNTWVKHCFGKVRTSTEHNVGSHKFFTVPRRVSSDAWYNVMKRYGLNYGHRFHGLKNIAASVTDYTATATVSLSSGSSESQYLMHPTTMDLAFQLCSVSAFRVQTQLFKKPVVSTFIGELYVSAAEYTDLRFDSTATFDLQGSFQYNIIGSGKDDRHFPIQNRQICGTR